MVANEQTQSGLGPSLLNTPANCTYVLQIEHACDLKLRRKFNSALRALGLNLSRGKGQLVGQKPDQCRVEIGPEDLPNDDGSFDQRKKSKVNQVELGGGVGRWLTTVG